jgi:hypothetical protein
VRSNEDIQPVVDCSRVLERELVFDHNRVFVCVQAVCCVSADTVQGSETSSLITRSFSYIQRATGVSLHPPIHTNTTDNVMASL